MKQAVRHQQALEEVLEQWHREDLGRNHWIVFPLAAAGAPKNWAQTPEACEVAARVIDYVRDQRAVSSMVICSLNTKRQKHIRWWLLGKCLSSTTQC